jgi:hypothetical protein
MTVDRRTFLAGAALVAVAPGVEMSAQKIPKQPANTRRIAFMIDGWSTQDDNVAADQLWIRVGYSWRTAWR